MIAYEGLSLDFGDALSALTADLRVHGRSTLWRFAPEDAELMEVQVWAGELEGLSAPMPDLPRAHHVVAAGPAWIGHCEARGYAPIDWGRNGDLPVVVFRKAIVPRWPRDLQEVSVRAQYTALAGWLKAEPWALPAHWCEAWRPLLAPLRAEQLRRFEAERMRRRTLSVRSKHEDLLTLIGASVELVKQGSQYWGRCPFHEDHEPSLSVHPEKGWFCHGCGLGGRQGSWIQATRGRRPS